MSAAESPSSSSRRAPATRSSRVPHCQMARPAAAASAVNDRIDTTRRWWRPLSTPPTSTAQIPAVRAMTGESPA